MEYLAGSYMRLSREDGDKAESDSIANQRTLLSDFLKDKPSLRQTEEYVDDGFTGTNFNRPSFQRLISDIEQGRINCVIVKDLSRFGRDYIDVGHYLERWFPERGIRFIAVNDHIDSELGPYDMGIVFKNVFNAQYAKDISVKVRSSLKAKQKNGEFIGAFSCYGYQRDTADKHHLVIDPAAAMIVKRIFSLYETGTGKIKIAKLLNAEHIPCPSEYKRLNGQNYTNTNKLENTKGWTYSTIHRMLRCQTYIGNMEQGRDVRPTMHGRAKALARDQWIVVEETHEPIIGKEQWERVQRLLQKNTKELDFEQNLSPFAGFLKCGDCGRALSKTRTAGGIYYSCGSYKRYGPTACSKHSIAHRVLENIVLADLNRIFAQAEDLRAMAEQSAAEHRPRNNLQAEMNKWQAVKDKFCRKRKEAYEDYRERLISREDYIRYKEEYEHSEAQAEAQLRQLAHCKTEEQPLNSPWVEQLIRHGRLEELDRATIAEVLDEIRIYEDNRIEITYTFPEELRMLIEFKICCYFTWR